MRLSRVTNLKSEGMQNQPTSVFSVRSTLGKIETMPQIIETLEKVCKIAISKVYKNGYVTRLPARRGIGPPAEMYATSIGLFKGLLTSVV